MTKKLKIIKIKQKGDEKTMQNKKTEVVTIRLDDETAKKITYYGEKEHRSKSEFVRHALLVYIEKLEEFEKMVK